MNQASWHFIMFSLYSFYTNQFMNDEIKNKLCCIDVFRSIQFDGFEVNRLYNLISETRGPIANEYDVLKWFTLYK